MKTINIIVEGEAGMNRIVKVIWLNKGWFRFFFDRYLLLSSTRLTLVGHIVFLITVAVILSDFEVLKLLNNDLVLAFDQSFKLFISRPDLVLQRGNHFISLLFDDFLKLGKFVFNSFEVILEFLQDTSCLLGDNSIDWGLDVGHSLWEECLDAWIFSLIDEFTLNLNDRFENFLDPLWRLCLFSCLDVACSQGFSASSMDHFDWVHAEAFRDVCWHMVLLHKALIGNKQIVELLWVPDHIKNLFPSNSRLCHLKY